MNRYNLCKEQKAQIDCRMRNCFYQKQGNCTNISPAITLNTDEKFNCWSFVERKCENCIHDNVCKGVKNTLIGCLEVIPEDLEIYGKAGDCDLFEHKQNNKGLIR